MVISRWTETSDMNFLYSFISQAISKEFHVSSIFLRSKRGLRLQAKYRGIHKESFINLWEYIQSQAKGKKVQLQLYLRNCNYAIFFLSIVIMPFVNHFSIVPFVIMKRYNQNKCKGVIRTHISKFSATQKKTKKTHVSYKRRVLNY